MVLKFVCHFTVKIPIRNTSKLYWRRFLRRVQYIHSIDKCIGKHQTIRRIVFDFLPVNGAYVYTLYLLPFPFFSPKKTKTRWNQRTFIWTLDLNSGINHTNTISHFSTDANGFPNAIVHFRQNWYYLRRSWRADVPRAVVLNRCPPGTLVSRRELAVGTPQSWWFLGTCGIMMEIF